MESVLNASAINGLTALGSLMVAAERDRWRSTALEVADMADADGAKITARALRDFVHLMDGPAVGAPLDQRVKPL